jgi:nucleoredoxin
MLGGTFAQRDPRPAKLAQKGAMPRYFFDHGRLTKSHFPQPLTHFGFSLQFADTARCPRWKIGQTEALRTERIDGGSHGEDTKENETWFQKSKLLLAFTSGIKRKTGADNANRLPGARDEIAARLLAGCLLSAGCISRPDISACFMKSNLRRRVLTLLVVSGLMAAGARARDWSLADGSRVTGDYAGGIGDVIFVKRADGSRVKLSQGLLSAEDRNYIQERQKGSVSIVKSDPQVSAALLKARQIQAQNLVGALLFGHKLVVPGPAGFVDAPAAAAAPDYYAIYFSAGWCAPCHKFTPQLVEFYRQNKENHANFEVVFVSSDHSERDMLNYMKQFSMPWPALRFEDAKSPDVDRYAGDGIPCLVVVDAEGKVVSNSYINGKYVGPQQPMQALGKLLASK